MNKNQAGFTIIEWLIYFFLIIFILTGLFHFVAQMQPRLCDISRTSGSLAQFCCALDGIAHDLATAPTDSQQWTKLLRDRIAWGDGNQKISWSCSGTTLYRNHQEFDKKNSNWSKTKKTVVCRDVDAVSFSFCYKNIPWKKEPLLVSVTTRLKRGGFRIERTTLLRNRVVVL